MLRRVLGIGWDVGGWRGSGQGIAVVEWAGDSPRWLGSPTSFSLSNLVEDWGVDDLVRSSWPEAPQDILNNREVVLAIDAPLGFPIAFRDLLAGGPGPSIDLKNPEIENRLAYRETDRNIHQTFRKKLLSASFDRIGNPATVAIVHTRRLSNAGKLRILPFDEPKIGIPIAIEVYPALLKETKPEAAAKLDKALLKEKKPKPVLRAVREMLPKSSKDGTHELDACLCALLALAYGYDGRIKSLPKLQGPHGSVAAIQYEGWIFHQDPASDWAVPSSEHSLLFSR
jgi:Protein of unknown function (DUF429)